MYMISCNIKLEIIFISIMVHPVILQVQSAK